MNPKGFLRKILNSLHIDITKNLLYDRLTKKIIEIAVKPDSICIDIGCHKGEILSLILKQAPKGGHYAFEPIPQFYEYLKAKYGKKNHVFSFALSDKIGETTFQYVKNAPAYSGMLKRRYEINNPIIEEITVKTITLDEILGYNQKIDFIKIDVEGAELNVLKGARKVIANSKPLVIFEFGKGASEYYNTTAKDIFQYFDELNMNIYTLNAWINKKNAFTIENFTKTYENNSEYYFVAYTKHKIGN